MSKLISGLVVLIASTGIAFADFSLQQCANIAEDKQRLACFDNYIANQNTKTKQAVAAAPLVASPAVAAAEVTGEPKGSKRSEQTVKENSVPKSIEDNFGLEHKKTKEELANDALRFTIAKAKKLPHGKWTLTFTNEQKWTTIATERMKFKAGQTAIISRGMFNSFSLKLPSSNRSVKVKRVK